ncbi:hypothetical protein [Altibacter sp. HG106]|uniref:hypothetical protein n=1 Tax=Altibacter sp. HG106 TaxID=3023937 RepID=UPI00234FDA69|nr:hypothetical protein [Altibacter sp. HG106]MDC7996313.1 hypothetical protein [Altibacter sp. HG106]
MRKLLFLLVLVSMISCTDKKKQDKDEMMPVEADGGIGDGAPPLDSVLVKHKDSLR